MNFPTKKYKILYVDCPWQYDDEAKSGDRGASQKYDIMSLDQIKALPIQQIADDNCWLFLWATEPLLQEGLDVIKSWGFKYKNFAFVWIKKTTEGKDFVGMGNYTRANPEYCLLGTKGKVEVMNHSVRKLVYSKIREHSRKPDIIYDRILKLCGDLPRIELFARTRPYGWSAVGDEIDGQDIKLSLQQIIDGTYSPQNLKESPLEMFCNNDSPSRNG